mmetsp:Transcript_52133/g.125891  ORF Transcript_52133/g.125891 Transcript_52133/m.125891 type:complete len:102 (+) Transcript_52133:1153-1458(+)
MVIAMISRGMSWIIQILDASRIQTVGFQPTMSMYSGRMHPSLVVVSDDEIFAHTKLSLLFIHNGGGDNGNGNSSTPSVPVWYDDPSKQPLFQSKYPANCGA